MTLMTWVRRRETPVQRWAYERLRALHRAEGPAGGALYRALGQEREFRHAAWGWLRSKLYYQPLLRARSHAAGRGLVLYDDMPKVIGNLRIVLGEDVRLEGDQVWMATGGGRPQALEIGDRTYVGYGTQLIAGTSIRIGADVLIANRVLVNGFDGHPLDPIARARGEPPGPEGYGPIVIDDYAWIGSNAIILKNVTIGRAAVVATGAVVTRDVPPLTVVAGNPARPVRTLDTPVEWRAA